jgi:hypothetical protein
MPFESRIEFVNLRGRDALQRAVAERRDNVQAQQLLVSLKGPGIDEPTARLIGVPAPL